MTFSTRRSLPEDAASIAARMRAADLDEVAAIGFDPLTAAQRSIERAVLSWTWLEDGLPLAIFGVGTRTLIGDVGEPWLLTAQGLERHPIRFLRGSLNALSQMRAMFPRLENWVDARYVVCVRYLGWLGFTVHPAQPYGMRGQPFHRFEIGVP